MLLGKCLGTEFSEGFFSWEPLKYGSVNLKEG